MQLIGRASDRHATNAGSIPRCGKLEIFLPASIFSADSLERVPTPPCAIACIDVFEHVTYPVVHVRVQWIMETLKHPTCTVGWFARLCRSWFSLAKATRISHGSNSIGTIQLLKKSVCVYAKS